MTKNHNLANYLLNETTSPTHFTGVTLPSTTQVLRDDYGPKIWPHGVTTDFTTLSPKELQDLIVYLGETGNPDFIAKYIKQTEDNLSVIEKEGQKNRAQDLRIRLSIAYAGLAISDRLGRYMTHGGV